MSWPGVAQRRVATNGIKLNIAEQGEGPLVLMLHGFPESWYSWRHQFAPLATAGYHAVAPDMRGYGKSDKPADIDAYNQVEVVNDIIGLIPALGLRNRHRDRPRLGRTHRLGVGPAPSGQGLRGRRTVGALHAQRERPPLDTLKEIFKGMFFYQLYFQNLGLLKRNSSGTSAPHCASSCTWPAGETTSVCCKPKPRTRICSPICRIPSRWAPG